MNQRQKAKAVMMVHLLDDQLKKGRIVQCMVEQHAIEHDNFACAECCDCDGDRVVCHDLYDAIQRVR